MTRDARGERRSYDIEVGAAATWRYIAVALLLGYFTPRFDDRGVPWLSTHLGEHQIVAFLQAVASGMMTFTGIIFSLLFVMLQFGTMAYSPRVVAVIWRPRTLGTAAGVFVGTFLYALMALRGVGVLKNGATSDLTIWVAFVWLLGSVFMLVRLVELLSGLMQTNVLFLLGDTGQREIERTYERLAPGAAPAPPDIGAPLGPATRVVRYEGPPRYLVALDVPRLARLAREADVVLRIPCSLGDAITERAVIAVVHGARAKTDVDDGEVRKALRVSRSRKLEADPKYAIRLLVDIAVRALATGHNQPSTAIEALDHIQALLTSLGNSCLETGAVRDATGALRLVYEATTWEDYLELGLTEIQHYGASSVQVERRLAEVVASLVEHLPAPRRAAVERMFGFLGAAPRDRQGLGHRVEPAPH
ncbi:MAG TPA: DUF2254 family protein [Polyangiaceae bacterium]|jgi:uncharacterized membrane protein|nr:DUF2254 family protein [Polyangiaceae bacterium]